MRTKRQLIGAAALVVAAAGIGTILAWQPRGNTAVASERADVGEGQQEASPDETAIRKTGTDFIKAFNASDAKAIAALWTKDAEYLQADGDELKGRDAIEKDFAEFFKNNPKATIEISVQSIRILGKNVAIEEGTTRVRMPGARAAGEAGYIVLHVRDDDRWRMASVREWVPDAAQMASLNDLSWLVGEWTAQGKDATVRVTYAWDEDKTTIRGRYTLTRKGKIESSGTHIIGKDPVRGLRAWVFDTSGTFGESLWWRDEDKWIIDASGSLPNGSELTAMNILVPINNDTFTWQSVDRVLAGTELPDVPPVRVTRVKR
jgi:uncharacterized protein (TIGR02246 family)